MSSARLGIGELIRMYRRTQRSLMQFCQKISLPYIVHILKVANFACLISQASLLLNWSDRRCGVPFKLCGPRMNFLVQPIYIVHVKSKNTYLIEMFYQMLSGSRCYQILPSCRLLIRLTLR